MVPIEIVPLETSGLYYPLIEMYKVCMYVYVCVCQSAPTTISVLMFIRLGGSSN